MVNSVSVWGNPGRILIRGGSHGGVWWRSLFWGRDENRITWYLEASAESTEWTNNNTLRVGISES